MIVSRAVSDVRIARESANLSLRQLAHELDSSPAALVRLMAGRRADLGIVELSEVASVLGYEISLGLHPVGDALRDKGQLAIGRRFQAILPANWRVTDETLLPGAGELRAWDKLLRLVGASPPYLVGVDIESRVHDVQALVRRTRLRERDGQVDAILVVLGDTATNRRVVDELRAGLGSDYARSPRSVLRSLRSGERLVGSGVVLI